MLMWGGWVWQTLWWSLGPPTATSSLVPLANNRPPEVEKILLEKFLLLHQLGKKASVII